jgi:hypothetical protein
LISSKTVEAAPIRVTRFVEKGREIMSEGYLWAIEFDIKDFFPSFDGKKAIDLIPGASSDFLSNFHNNIRSFAQALGVELSARISAKKHSSKRPLLAQSGHAQCADECLLLGVKRT